jgi:type IV secretory pathway TraG/TraD family ATPase VirD4
MRQIETKNGKRWRCIKSIEAAKQSRKEREAFGRKTTDMNRSDAQAKLRIIKPTQP